MVQYLALLRQVDDFNPEDMSYLVLQMLSVLPERLKFEAQKIPKEDRSVEAIIKLIDANITSRLEVNSFSDSSRQSEKRLNPQPQRQSHYSNSRLYHTSSRVSNASDSRPCNTSSRVSNASDSRPCIYCQGNGHSPHMCEKLSQEERQV